MSRYAIIAIGYNRIKSIKRLLESLSKADYKEEKVDLIISIDHSGDNSVAEFAEDFYWSYGSKKVRTFKERQGLRKHVMSCGDFLEDYEAVAVFEDDIYVSPGFYHYMKAAVDFYKEDDNIGGISLYNHLWNVHANRPFLPKRSKYDTYFMQFPQSWGQVWMKKGWLDFKRWYHTQGDEFTADYRVPEYVSKWPNTSWLKYHVKYLVEQNKYFVYPYESLTTNFTDVGENFTMPTSGFHVPMELDIPEEYYFPEFTQGKIKYDAYFENELLGSSLQIEDEDLCVDLYDAKKNPLHKRYWLTMEILDYKIIRSFGLYFRPHEDNVIQNIQGNQIFLYDTSTAEKNPYKQKPDLIKANYDYRGDNISLHTLKDLMINKVNRQLKRK